MPQLRGQVGEVRLLPLAGVHEPALVIAARQMVITEPVGGVIPLLDLQPCLQVPGIRAVAEISAGQALRPVGLDEVFLGLLLVSSAAGTLL